MEKKDYFLGLGSNMGDLNVNLDQAIYLITEIKGVTILQKSSYYKTKPWGYKEQSDFLNCVIMVECEYEPKDFWEHLKEIEIKMGKKVICQWGPRVIDIDILFCGDLVLDTEDLKIPHPLLHERDFVLLPMKEIAPEFVHPVLKMRISEISNY